MKPQKKLKVNRVLAIKVPGDLQKPLQDFIDQGGYLSVSEAIKVLLVRGLYLEEKPSGRLSEPAFLAAYIAAKGSMLDVAQRKLGAALNGIMNEVFAEVVARQGRAVL